MKRVAASLILLAALLDLVLGISALAGAERLEANIREIETASFEAGGKTYVFGDLYFPLGVWGVIMLVVGLGLGYGGWRLLGNREHDRLIGLVAAYFALLPALLGLAIFRWPQLAVIVVLLVAIVLLTYRVDEQPSR